MRIYSSKKKTNKTAIIFLGASPDGEQHKAINYLSKILTKFNYNVFIPRIPPLKNLDISSSNIKWFIQFYNWVIDKYEYDKVPQIYNNPVWHIDFKSSSKAEKEITFNSLMNLDFNDFFNLSFVFVFVAMI